MKMKRRTLGLVASALFCAPMGSADSALAGVSAESSTPGYRVEAVELKRDGSGGITLTLNIHNDSDKKGDLSCELRADKGETCKQISGVYLIDVVNKKRHLVMRDADGKCICTDTLGNVPLNNSVTVWAKFPEPPSEVGKMTVIVPLFLPLDGVPVTGP
jgi:hypothetical protein